MQMYREIRITAENKMGILTIGEAALLTCILYEGDNPPTSYTQAISLLYRKGETNE